MCVYTSYIVPHAAAFTVGTRPYWTITALLQRVAGGGTQRQHLTDLNPCMLLALLQECHPPEERKRPGSDGEVVKADTKNTVQ